LGANDVDESNLLNAPYFRIGIPIENISLDETVQFTSLHTITRLYKSVGWGEVLIDLASEEGMFVLVFVKYSLNEYDTYSNDDEVECIYDFDNAKVGPNGPH